MKYIAEIAQNLFHQLNQKIYGQREAIELVIVTVMCGEHALVTGMPGVAKTTLVKNLAAGLGCDYKRIQFTPDLTPFDILGGDTLGFQSDKTQPNQITFSPGPIFTNFVLADEINRTSPRTQSALLEAMQEHQVTLGNKTHPLPSPFFVFATQNPLESEGTFPLPDAQMDRFLCSIPIPYPEFKDELKIAQLPSQNSLITKVPHAELLFQAPHKLQSQQLKSDLVEAAVRIVRNTRPESTSLSKIQNYVEAGAGPRAAQALVKAARALSVLRGDSDVTLEHLFTVAPRTLAHRCVLNYKAATEKITPEQLIATVIKETIL